MAGMLGMMAGFWQAAARLVRRRGWPLGLSALPACCAHLGGRAWAADLRALSKRQRW